MSLNTRPMRLALHADADIDAAIADGIHLPSALPAFLSLNDTDLRSIIKLGQLDGKRDRGLDILPLMSGGSDGDTAVLKIYRVSPIVDRGSNASTRAYRTELLYTLALTASSLTYAAGKIGDDTTVYRAVDTVALTATSDRAVQLQTKVGASISIHSPGGNTQAVITLPDLDGGYGIILAGDTSAGLFNALYELKT